MFLAWVFGCLDPLFSFSDLIFSWGRGAGNPGYMHVFKRDNRLKKKSLVFRENLISPIQVKNDTP